jgi:hypothetical protein
VSLLNPGALYSLTGVSLETGRPQAAPPGYWAGVAGQLRLTPRQTQDLLAIHELYERQAER